MTSRLYVREEHGSSTVRCSGRRCARISASKMQLFGRTFRHSISLRTMTSSPVVLEITTALEHGKRKNRLKHNEISLVNGLSQKPFFVYPSSMVRKAAESLFDQQENLPHMHNLLLTSRASCCTASSTLQSCFEPISYAFGVKRMPTAFVE